MTKLLDRAVDAARALPPEMQDEIAYMLLQFVGAEQPVIPLTHAERSSLEASLAQAERGEFATDEQVRAIWAKHGL
jgi:predicted transcriptional regulator